MSAGNDNPDGQGSGPEPNAENKKGMKSNIWAEYFLKTAIAVIVFSLGVFVFLLNWNTKLIKNEIETRAKDQIRHIVKTRAWNAHYGGVYVEKREGVESNPYLEDPDITAMDGKVYTLKNPALMTREISELFEKDNFLKFHMTSLNPINPANKPDAFERKALNLFEKGEKDYSVKEHINGTVNYRYMVPLFVEKSCLQCHARQGYREGDIRGGISVTFDITKIEKSLGINKFFIVALGIVSAVALLGVIYAFTSILMKKLEKSRLIIEELAVTDDLTHLYNRRHFYNKLKNEIKRSRRFGLDLGCIILDIDFFKKVNDKYGHQAGDKVLKNVAETVRGCCRGIDILARYGGEEFIVLLPGTDIKGACILAEKIRAAVENSKIVYQNDISLHVTISLGVAGYTADDLKKIISRDQIIKYADSALYRAKEKGRNRVEIAENIMM